MTDEKQNLVNCKSCGEPIDVSGDPENWPLQCANCKKAGATLPKGYEHLKGGEHDN